MKGLYYDRGKIQLLYFPHKVGICIPSERKYSSSQSGNVPGHI